MPRAGPGQPAAIIPALNLDRRMLNKGQRAIYAAMSLEYYGAAAKGRQREGGRRGGVTPKHTHDEAPEQGSGKIAGTYRADARDEAAAAAQVSPRYVSDGKRLLDHAPALAEEAAVGALRAPVRGGRGLAFTGSHRLPTAALAPA